MAAKIDDMTSKMESLYLPGSPIRGYYSTSQAPVADVYPGLSRTNSWNSSSDQSNREMPIRGYYSTSQTPAADVYPGLSRTNSWNSSSDQSNRRMSLSAPSLPPGALEAPDLLSLQYLTHLVQEQKQLTILFPKMFTHVERLLETEIARVREALFQNDFNIFDIELPEPDGPLVNITEKLYIPVREFPEYNFVGRILGPRGMTAKQLEQETGCRIMVRGRGSMKDKRKEDAHRGRPNWEHLEDDLHVLIQCEYAENRCQLKLASAVAHIGRLLVPTPDGSDDLKRKQLMELAIINGTYRPYHRQQRETKTLLPLLSVSSADPFSSLF